MKNLMSKIRGEIKFVIVGEMLYCYFNNGMNYEDFTITETFEYSKREWLRPYIEFNIQTRKEAKARGDKLVDVFFKLWKDDRETIQYRR